MQPTVTPLLRTPSLELARFRCPPSVPLWQTENTIGPLAHVVFPERPVAITRPGTGPQLGDRNWALLYRPEQRYLRRLVDPEGDDCTYLALSTGVHDEMLAATGHAQESFDAGRVLVDDRTWLDYQQCLAIVGHPGAEPDELAVESRLFSVLTALLQDPGGGEPDGAAVLPRNLRSRGRTYRRVHEACTLLATHLDERLTISAVADSVGLSAYHFCRQFRAVTGLTVHAYRERLRLRQAFSTCATTPGSKLSDVAIASGYASHSHMSTRFRETLRMTPSDVRDRYAGASAAALRSGVPGIW